MAEEKKQLQVGDIIYVFQYGSLTTNRYVIQRVTEKVAFAENERGFYREYSGTVLRERPYREFSSYQYVISTEELWERFKRLVLIQRIQNIVRKGDWGEKLETGTLSALYEMIKREER